MDIISEFRYRKMIGQIQLGIIEQEFGPLSRYALSKYRSKILTISDLEQKQSVLRVCRTVWIYRYWIFLAFVAISFMAVVIISWTYNLGWIEGIVDWIFLNWIYHSPPMEYP